MKAALIVNGKSRRGREWYSEADVYLREHGVDLIQSQLVKDPRQVDSLVRKAIAANPEVICVGGGDGTISMASSSLANTPITLGLLPFGTGNSLARDLKIPTSVAEACDIVLAKIETKIDLGKVGDRSFINVATAGLTTLIAESLDSGAKKRFGRIAYLAAIWKATLQAKQFHARIKLEDEELNFESVQIVVGNGRFHAGPFPITPEAEIDSGYLSGYSVNSSRKGVLLRYLLRLWHGRHVDMPEVVPFNARSLHLETVPIRKITVDGEVCMSTPATFESQPGALRVCVPPEFLTDEASR